jgi:hypothetical protein
VSGASTLRIPITPTPLTLDTETFSCTSFPSRRPPTPSLITLKPTPRSSLSRNVSMLTYSPVLPINTSRLAPLSLWSWLAVVMAWPGVLASWLYSMAGCISS